MALGSMASRGGRASLHPTVPGTHWQSSNPATHGVNLQNHLQEFACQEFSGKRLDVQHLKKKISRPHRAMCEL